MLIYFISATLFYLREKNGVRQKLGKLLNQGLSHLLRLRINALESILLGKEYSFVNCLQEKRTSNNFANL